MDNIKIKTLGGFSVEKNGHRISFTRSKANDIIKILSIFKSISSEKLTFLFDCSKKCITTAVYSIRKELDTDIINYQKGIYSFSDNVEVDIDNFKLENYKEFLPYDYLGCIVEERSRLESEFLNGADVKIVDLYDDGKYIECIKLCEKIISVDHLWENAYYHKMLACLEINRRAQAVLCYRKCKKILKKELDLEPSDDIKKVKGRIA